MVDRSKLAAAFAEHLGVLLEFDMDDGMVDEGQFADPVRTLEAVSTDKQSMHITPVQRPAAAPHRRGGMMDQFGPFGRAAQWLARDDNAFTLILFITMPWLVAIVCIGFFRT